MDNIETPKAFPLTFDFAEGDSFTNELLKGRKVENIQDLRTLLAMLEGDAPESKHGYRKVYFHTQGLMLGFHLNSDCQESRSSIINSIDEQVGLA